MQVSERMPTTTIAILLLLLQTIILIIKITIIKVYSNSMMYFKGTDSADVRLCVDALEFTIN